MRAANADLNEDQFAAQLDIALRRLSGMSAEAQRGKLLAIRAELERLTAPPPLPIDAPTPTANAPTRMSQPPGSVRIGAEDAFEPLPLPSGFNEFDDSLLDGLS